MRRLDCLECVVDGTKLLVPVADLDRVAEYPLTEPPPRSEPWVGGLGLFEGRAFLSLSLAGAPRGPLPFAKGLLFRASETVSAYAVQVDSVLALWTVDEDAVLPGTAPAWPCPQSWLCAVLEGGESLLRLDPAAVAASLFPAPSTTEA